MDSQFQVKITADISELQSRLAAVEAITGKFSKSMDKAADSVKNMEQNANRGRMVAFAFGQVIRDAGFFSNSFSLGILAISNNIPILIDQLALSVKVLQPFAGALSLVGSLLTAGLTIWAYSTQEVKKNKQSLEEWKSSLDDLTESQLRGSQAATEELTKLDFLYKASTNAANGVKTRISAAQQLQDLYPSIFGNYSTEEIMLGKVSGAYNNLRVNILEAAKAQARFDKIVENSNKILDNQERSKQIRIELNNIEAQTTLDVAKKVNALNESYRNKGSNYQVDLESINKIIQSHLAENAVYQSLNSELQTLNKNTSELNNYNKQLEAQTNGNTTATQALTQKMAGYNKETEKAIDNTQKLSDKLYGRMATESLPGLRTPISGPAVKPTTITPGSLNTNLTAFQKAEEVAKGMLPSLHELYSSIAATVTDGISEVTMALADGIGQMIAGEMGLADFGRGMLASMGKFLSQLGKQMIAFGVSALLFAKVYAALATGNFAAVLASAPGLIAAGLALTIAGGIISSLAGRGGNAAAVGGGGGGFNSQFTTPMSNAVSASMYGRFNGTLETRVSGNDLVILMNRADRNRRGNY